MKCRNLILAATWFLGTGSLAGAQVSSFRALSGTEAERFVLPDDTRLVRSGRYPRYGLRWERYQQYQHGVPVLGGEITVHRNESDVAVLVIGASYPTIAPANRARLTPSLARSLAVRGVGPGGEWSSVLMLDPVSKRFFHRVESRRFTSHWNYWIDADNGSVLRRYDGLTTGEGIGVKGDVKDLTGLTTQVFGFFALRSADFRQTVRDARSHELSDVLAFLLPEFLIGPIARDTDDHWDLPGRTSPGQPALVDAAYYVSVTDQYYQSVHGRDSFNDAGMPIVAFGHFSEDVNNAFWNGRFMVFGDGNGQSLLEFSGALDVVAHEFTHGVTEFTSGLIYLDEPGALNESFSDIIGNSVEFFADASGLDPAGTPDWLISEDIDLGSDTEPGFRNMADPAEDGDPDHYSERQIGGGDNGGVHTNSGISNHAFFLLVNGGSNAGEGRGHPHSGPLVTGVGLATAEQIFYLGFTSLTLTSDMCQARLATQAAAAAMFPAQAQSVSDAWEAVGVPDGCYTPRPVPSPSR
jgi:Zn-dependent metalloprotease